MKEVTAQLNSHRQSPRKVRLVADVLRDKSVLEARSRLDLITKKATGPLHKLLDSAVANAKNLGFNTESMKVKSITVNGGAILHRRRPVSHGSAHPIKKRTSHIKIILIGEELSIDSVKSKNKKSKK